MTILNLSKNNKCDTIKIQKYHQQKVFEVEKYSLCRNTATVAVLLLYNWIFIIDLLMCKCYWVRLYLLTTSYIIYDNKS